jgi:hypothetical protein
VILPTRWTGRESGESLSRIPVANRASIHPGGASTHAGSLRTMEINPILISIHLVQVHLTCHTAVISSRTDGEQIPAHHGWLSKACAKA